MMEIINGTSSQFTVLSGDDALTVPLLGVGGDGCISVVSNEIPREFTMLVTAGLDGDFVSARKLHYQFLDLIHGNFIETNPIPVKTALSLMGKVEEIFRLPLCEMEMKNKEELKKILKGHSLL